MNTHGETINEQRTMDAIQRMAINISDIKDKTPTLRDQFAMSVMAAWAGGSWNGTPMHSVIEGKHNLAENLAVAAYKVADEMLKAREK